MKTAEILLKAMDWLQKLATTLNTYADRGLDIFQKAKVWIEKALEYIEKAIDTLVQTLGGRKSETKMMSDDHLFV
jgi:hypothetical protein